LATHSDVSPRAADGCIARMMRKPDGARLTSDAALLLSSGVGLLVRHALSNLAAPGWDDWIARTMRKPDGAKLPRVVALLL
jgi:hypothetical protein